MIRNFKRDVVALFFFAFWFSFYEMNSTIIILIQLLDYRIPNADKARKVS